MTGKMYYGNETGKHEAKGKELDYILQTQAELQEQARLIEAEQTKKDADRANAMAKLSKLGLTEEEINAIL